MLDASAAMKGSRAPWIALARFERRLIGVRILSGKNVASCRRSDRRPSQAGSPGTAVDHGVATPAHGRT